MLDYSKPSTIALAAARISALVSAASCISTGSSPTSQLECDSISQYLIELAGEIAKTIEEIADSASFVRDTK